MTDREKIIKALAPLRASDTAVQEVLEMAEHRNTHTIKKSSRTILIAAVVAVLLIGTALAAYSGLSAGLREYLHVTDDTAAKADAMGLVSDPIVSDTHDGVTVSVERAVADGNAAFIALRVEGLEVPEGRSPTWGSVQITLDGERASNWDFGAYADMTWDGEKFCYSDGTAAPLTEEGVPIPRYFQADGTLEFDLSIAPQWGEDTSLVGREMQVTISRLGTEPVSVRYIPEEERDYTAEGPWVLTWTLDGSDIVRTWKPNAALGDTGATVTSVTLSALAVHIDYDYPMQLFDEIGFDQDGNETVEQSVMEPPFLYKIVMKDGTEYTGVLGGGTCGYTDDMNTYELDMGLTHIIDPDEVAALVFWETVLGDVPDSEVEFYTVTLPD